MTQHSGPLTAVIPGDRIVIFFHKMKNGCQHFLTDCFMDILIETAADSATKLTTGLTGALLAQARLRSIPVAMAP